MTSLAQRLFDGSGAESEIEDYLDDHGLTVERIGWDYYDRSLELHGVPATQRLDEAAQEYLYKAGFCKVYVNHEDQWETHYGFDLRQPFAATKGWRVSYRNKFDRDDKRIWVEEVVPTWPPEWFDTGYAVVKECTTPNAGTPHDP